MDKKKKILLLIIIGIFILALLIALYFVIRGQNNPYVKDPITQESLSIENKEIALNDIDIEGSDAAVYEVSSKVMLEEIEEFVSKVGSKLKQTEESGGSYYEWANGDNYVIYDLEDNTMQFRINEGLDWNEADITGYSFNKFAKEYFNKDWEYNLNISEKQPQGETIFFANKKVGEQNIEMVSNKNATDYLATKNGQIIYGKFLLAEFIEVEKRVPLINSDDLNKYINIKGYPKEIHPEFGSLRTTLLTQIDYKGDEFEDVIGTLTNCKTMSSSIIYLYKSLDQENLTPVYKLELQCELTYKETLYTIPAIGYVSAIDPNYISTAE